MQEGPLARAPNPPNFRAKGLWRDLLLRPRYRLIIDAPRALLLHHVTETATTALSLQGLLEELPDDTRRHVWRLYGVEESGEPVAAAAFRSADGLCLLHGVDPAAVQLLAAQLTERVRLTKLSGEYDVIDWALAHPDVGPLAWRDHREYFMVLRLHGCSTTADGNYRAAEPADIPALQAYADGYATERHVVFRRNWRELIRRRDIIVAETPGPEREIACCLMRGVTSFPLVSIGGVYTFPAFREQGYASRLIANVAQECFAAGFSLCLMVDDDNDAAVRTYEKAGFITTGLYRDTYLQVRPSLRRKRLAWRR